MNSARALAAMAAAESVGWSAAIVLPLLLGSLVEGLGISETQAGLIVSAEYSALAVVSLGLARRADRWNRRRLAWMGALLVCAGNAFAASTDSLPTLLLARVIVGSGAGSAVVAANAAAAAARVPERTFALLAICGGVGGALLLAGMPHLILPYGHAGGFGLLAGAALLCLPVLRWMPPHPDPAKESVAARFGRGRALLLALIAAFLLVLGMDVLWAFVERIGVAVGVGPAHIGGVLAIAAIAGLPAAGLASWLGTRIGRVVPLCVGIGGSAGAVLVVACASSPTAYVVGLLVWAPSVSFSFPYLLGTLSALDPQGRATAVAGAVMTVGTALGPGVAGLLAMGGGYASIGWVAAATSLAALGLILPAARRADRIRPGA